MKLSSVVAPAPLLILLFMTLSGPAVFADDDVAIRGPLTCQIEYWSVGHLGEHDDDGWLLAWKGKVSGDLAGSRKSHPLPKAHTRTAR